MDEEEKKRLILEMSKAGKSREQIIAHLDSLDASVKQPAQNAGNPNAANAVATPTQTPPESRGALSTSRMVPFKEGMRPDTPADVGPLRAMAQGATLGLAEGIEGRVRSLLPGRTYEGEVGKIRAENERFREENPGAGTALEFMGGTALPFGFLGKLKYADEAGKALKAGSKLWQGAKLGAKAGAVAGGVNRLGHSEGSFFDRINQTAGGVATGGAAGFLLGGATVPVAELAVRGASSLAKKGAGMLDRLTSSVQRVAGNEAGYIGKAAPPSGSPAKALFGQEPSRAQSKALKLTNERFGEIPTDDAQMLADRAERELVGADYGGESFQSLFGTAVGKGTPEGVAARPWLAQRGQNRGVRMASDVTKATKLEPVNLADDPAEPWRTVRQSQIRDADRPAIDAAYRATEQSPPVALSEATQDVLERPLVQQAIEKARALALNEPKAARRTLSLGTPERPEAAVTDLNMVAKELKNAMRLSENDNERRLLGDAIAEIENDLSTDAAQATATEMAAKSFRAQDAVVAGKNLGTPKSTVDDIETALKAMDPRAQEEARRAMAQVRRQSAMENPDKLLAPKKAVHTDLKTRAQFGDEAADELGRRNDLEVGMRGTETSYGGSQTSERGFNSEAIEGAKLTPMDILSMGRAGAHLGLQMGKDVLAAPGRARADALVKIGMAGKDNPMDLQTLMELLRGMRKDDANKLAQALRASGSLGSLAGRAGGP